MKLQPLVENHNKKVFLKEYFAMVVAVHVMTILVAPFLFSWGALALAVGSLFFFGYSMGVFHHMLLNHRSYVSNIWLERLGSLLGTLTWRGPFAGPVRYVAMHRIHHEHSDTDLDHHSPHSGGILHAWLT